MKVAEIFAELGFKFEGKDELKSFETSLQNIANAARNAALALKILSRTPVPRALTATPRVAPTNSTTTPAAVTPAPGTAPSGAPPSTPSPAPAPVPNIPAGFYGSAYHGPASPYVNGYGAPPLASRGPAPISSSVLQGLKSLGAMGLKVLGVATVAIALKKLVSALVDMVKASMVATYAVDKFTTQTGMSRRELKQWEHVAEISDVKAEELQESLKNLQQRSRQIRFTGEGATPFLQLGVNGLAAPTDVLKQFAQRTKQMDTATAVFFGAQMGISENMVYLLRKNADKLDDLVKGGELSDSQHQAVMELNAAWKELTFNMGLLRDRLVSEVAPAIKWVLDQMTSWTKLNVTTGGKAALFNALPPSLGLLATPFLANRGTGNTTKVENNISVEVSGAGSPKETAKATMDQIKKEFSDSFYGRPPPYSNR